MTRRLRLTWPDPVPFARREGRPIRLLAVSDEPDRALEYAGNREALGAIDAVVGCGDLEPDWLGFVADAFCAPLSYVRGNHDRGLGWDAGEGRAVPAMRAGIRDTIAGIRTLALPWPVDRGHANRRDDGGAWFQVAAAATQRPGGVLFGRGRPFLVVSHVPPAGANDGPDSYHAGFAAYRWLMDRARPPLWLHGHVTMATVDEPGAVVGATTLVNVTGSVLVELDPPGAAAPGAERDAGGAT